jgi:hypothetical protein
MTNPLMAITVVLTLDAVLVSLLICLNHPEQIPATIISSIALGFSFYAYIFSRERFRLELLNKRWEIYEQVLKFCSVVAIHGGLPKHSDDESINKSVISGLEAAHESFRGIGIHKAKSLFGPEIHKKLEELNAHYAWFVARPRGDGWAEKENNHLLAILNTIEELPNIFRPYVYFGDYKQS